MYAFLWWMRGILVYLLLERFLPAYTAFRFLAGGLVLVHAADSSMLWIGQLNQQGFLFWLILALYCFVVAFQQEDPYRRAVWMLAAAFFQHMTLWTYESPAVIIVTSPILILAFRPTLQRFFRFSVAWMIMPGIYLLFTAIRYALASNAANQMSLMRKDWAMTSLIRDFATNIGMSFGFWSWGSGTPGEFQLGLGAAVVMLCGFTWLAWRQIRRGDPVFPSQTKLIVLALYGAWFSILSFPAYLLLRDAVSGWRTQMLSGPGTMIAIAALIGILTGPMGARGSRWIVVRACGDLRRSCCPEPWWGTSAAMGGSKSGYGAHHATGAGPAPGHNGRTAQGAAWFRSLCAKLVVR